MKRTLQVYAGDEGRLVGTLGCDQNGAREHAAFAYDETWLAAADRFALEPNLPLVKGTMPASLREQGDAVFERSRAKAQAALEKLQLDLKTRATSEELVQIAYLGRIAFHEGDHRVFYNDIAGAFEWLSQ